jgi:hypothetical protein
VRILLSFESFVGFAGTETYTLTVAMELDRLGHDVAIYSPQHGGMAEFARKQGIRVIGRPELAGSCDLVISSDAATCHELAGRYRDAVRIFVAHSTDYVLQAPPQLHDRCQTIVVLNDRVRRAVEARAWHAPLVRLRQPIDLYRFHDYGPGRSTARTALVLSNNLKGPRATLIEDACRANGLNLTWVGASTHQIPTPELAIARAELIIGLGRSVLEAMSTGRAAYVYGVIGGDGWVTPERYSAMEADGFAGTAARELPIAADRLAYDLGCWNKEMGVANRDLACAHHSAREHAVELVNLARNLHAFPPVEPSVTDELSHLIRLQWHDEGRLVASLAESNELRGLLAEREAEVATLRAQLAEALATTTRLEGAARAANGQLEALRSTRRYRLACRLASPLDKARAYLRRVRRERPRHATGVGH